MRDIQPRQQLGTLFTYRATFIIANTAPGIIHQFKIILEPKRNTTALVIAFIADKGQ